MKLVAPDEPTPASVKVGVVITFACLYGCVRDMLSGAGWGDVVFWLGLWIVAQIISMMFYRGQGARAVFGLIGLALMAGLTWTTNWQFTAYCCGAALAGAAAYDAGKANLADVPLWMSSAAGQLFLALVGLAATLSPLLVGVIWFRWWWGLAGYVGGIGAMMASPSFLPLTVRLLAALALYGAGALSLARML
jgi:hypothetical protein